MNKRPQKTLALIFKNPVQSNVKWKDIEKLLIYLGAEISEGSGSRVRIELMELRQFSTDHIQDLKLIKVH